MTLLSTYLSKSKVKKVLASKPGQEGFSLIELVVVVAVLAVLSAIAIPQFTNISSKARAVAASNTIATIAKECAAKIADAGSGTFVPPVSIQGYVSNTAGTAGFFVGTARAANANATACPTTGTITLASEDVKEYPTFTYNVGTGAKTCIATSGEPAENRGCKNSVW